MAWYLVWDFRISLNKNLFFRNGMLVYGKDSHIAFGQWLLYGKRVLISVQLNGSYTRILVKVITKLILNGTSE